MFTVQSNCGIIPCVNRPSLIKQSKSLPSSRNVVCFNGKLPVINSLKLESPCKQRFVPLVKHKRYASVSKCRQGIALCKLGGEEDKPAGSNEWGSPWKAIEKGIGNFGKQPSIEDVLKRQIENQEYYDDGGSKDPPRGGGGNGGSGGDGSGESEDESLSGILDETLQVILATLGFIFLYVYIITGEEIARLVKDYIKFLFGGNKSVRLRRAMNKWRMFFQKLNEKKVHDEYWLEKAIITTPTWYDSPEKYRQVINAYIEPDDDDEEEEEEDDAGYEFGDDDDDEYP